MEGRISHGEIQIRLLYRNEEHWVEVESVPYRFNDDGTVNRLIGVTRDVTDHKVIGELRRLRDKAEEANRLKTAFLANMSHEIRTPLNAIVGFSYLIAHTEDKKEAEKFSEIIQANNDLLVQIINDILDLSKIEAGKMEYNYTDVTVAKVIDNVVDVFTPRLKPGVLIYTDIPDSSLVVKTEEHRLTQVFSNLLSNACKFTEKGYIQIGFKHEQERIFFFVRDTGCGIAEKDKSFIFDRFSKVDKFVQGSGLGLPISKTIVENLGGTITVESELGKGSCFYFSLPETRKDETQV